MSAMMLRVALWMFAGLNVALLAGAEVSGQEADDGFMGMAAMAEALGDPAPRQETQSPSVTISADSTLTDSVKDYGCMEGQTIAFHAEAAGFPKASAGNELYFTFVFTKIDGSTHTCSHSAWESTKVTCTCAMGKVSESPTPAFHFYDISVTVTVTMGNLSATSSPITIRVYELWIKTVKDHDSGKYWKVVVGKTIDVDALASNSCKNWSWDMPDGVPDAWNPEGGNRQTGTMVIPYTDLYSGNDMKTSRADNDWFGEAYGTVYVKCEDSGGTTHSLYSTDMNNDEKASVFFSPDRALNGGPPLTERPPAWLIFWSEGGVVEGIEKFVYNDELESTAVAWGTGGPSTPAEFGPGARTDGLGHTAITLRSTFTNTSVTVNNGPKDHIDWIANTVAHENYHRHCQTTWRSTGITNSTNADTDGLPDNEENAPSGYQGATFPISNPNDPDTYSFGSNYNLTYNRYGDQEIRARIAGDTKPATVKKDLDWSAVAENPKW